MMGTGGPTPISYDSSRFNPKPSADYLCPICHCVLFEPRMCPCQHIFCRECIETWLARSATCPTCRNHTMLRQMLPAPPLVQSVLNSLTMDCDYKDKGCSSLVTMERFASHLNSCDFRPAKCPFDDCQVETTVHGLPEHKESCQYRRERCTQICCLEFPFHKLEKHDCVTTLKDKVQELTKRLIDHQVILRWMRQKLSHCHLPQEVPGIHIHVQAYHRMVNDINLYWPTDQAFPVGLLGPLMFAPAASTVESSQIEDDDHILTSSNVLLKKIARELSALDNDHLIGRFRFPEGERPAVQHSQEQLPVSSMRSVGTAVHGLLIPYETHHQEEQEVSTARQQTRAAEYNSEELIGGGRSVGRIRNPWAHWGDLSEEDVGHVDRNYSLYQHMYPDFQEWRTPHDVWNLRPAGGSNRSYMDDLPGPSSMRNRSRSRSVSNERSRSRRGSRSPSIVYERSRSPSRSGSALETYDAHLRSRSRSRSRDYNQSPRSYAYHSRSGSSSSYSTRSRSGRANSRDSYRPADEFHDTRYSPQGLGNIDSYRTRPSDRNYNQSPLSLGGHESDRAGLSYNPRDDVPYLGDRASVDVNVWVYMSPNLNYRSPDPQDEGEWSQEGRQEENGNRPTAREELDLESDSRQYTNSPSWTPSSYSREHTGQDNMSDSPSLTPEYRSFSSLSSSSTGTDQNLSFQEPAGVDQGYSDHDELEDAQSHDQDELEDAQSPETLININPQNAHDMPAEDSSQNQGSVRSSGSVVEGSFSPPSSILHTLENHEASNSDSASSFSSPMNSRSWKSGERKRVDRVQGESGIPHSPDHHPKGRSDHEAHRGLWDSYSDTTSLDYELDSPMSLNGKARSTSTRRSDSENSESGLNTSAGKRESSASPARSEDKWVQSNKGKKGLSKKICKWSSEKKKLNCVSPSERDMNAEGEGRSHSGCKQKQNFQRESKRPRSASSAVDDNQPSTSGQQHLGKKLSKKCSHGSLKSSGKDLKCRKRTPTEDDELALPTKRHKSGIMQTSGLEIQRSVCHSLDMDSAFVTAGATGSEARQMETVLPGLSARKSRCKRLAPSDGVVEEAQITSTRTAVVSNFNVEAAGSSIQQHVHHKKHHRHDHHAKQERVHQAHNIAESPDQGTGQRNLSTEQSRSHRRRILHSERSQRTEHTSTNGEEDASGLVGRNHCEREETGQRGQRLMTLETGRSLDVAAVPPVESVRPSIGREEADTNRGAGCGQTVPPQGSSQRRVTCADGGRESKSRHDLEARGTRLVTIEDLPIRPSTMQLLDIYTSYNDDESDSTWSPSSSCSDSTE